MDNLYSQSITAMKKHPDTVNASRIDEERDRTPSPLGENMFKSEYKYLRDPMNKTHQKYNILYQVLAPKLMMKKGLVHTKIQMDAFQVIKTLSEDKG